MLGDISFIGGIHGVGKSTICEAICEQVGIQYLSASELIKWREINVDPLNKKVSNIPGTQDRLITGLKHATLIGKKYLLDGHYCLLDSSANITPVPVEIFRAMKPVSFHLIRGDISEIKQRLEARDTKVYDVDLLDHMQQCELEHAKSVSSMLGVDLSIGTQAEYSGIIAAIKRFNML